MLIWMKICNLMKCSLSYLLSISGYFHFTHVPTTIAIEPANYCQLRCPECPVGINKTSHSKILEISVFNTILNAFPKQVHSIIFYFQGEPTLNMQLPNMIRMAKTKQLYTYLSTNGQRIDKNFAKSLIDSGLDHIVLSIDGISQKSYTSYRVGGSVYAAFQALDQLQLAKQKAKSSLFIEWQCLALKSNEYDWKWMRKNFRRLGANKFTLKTAQFNHFEKGNPLLPTLTAFARYKRLDNGTFVRKKGLHHRCWKLWTSCVIDIDGNMLPCCFDKNRKYSFGNIFTSSFSEVWFSDSAMQFRRNLLINRHLVGICQNCSE